MTNVFSRDKLALSEQLAFEPYRARARRTDQKERVIESLNQALTSFPPQSVRGLALQLHVDPNFVWRSFPNLAAEISTRHSAYTAQLAASRRAEFTADVRAALDRFGPSIAPNQMKAILEDPACYLNCWKREVIMEEIAAVLVDEAPVGAMVKTSSNLQ
ncbi:hypothetical protein [Paraburkholderia dilworthii]|uniref:hypothetical protein n=1 Tax=Paraburkholderia dilworthii TaxID=948106 RepID=UPI001FCA4CD7|nr:hypothetical protein [Paraburkholderia dilworthii]